VFEVKQAIIEVAMNLRFIESTVKVIYSERVWLRWLTAPVVLDIIETQPGNTSFTSPNTK